MKKERHLRVLSYNIHKGFNVGNRRFVLEGIRAAIELVHADLVLLQEVLGDHSEHKKKVKGYPLNSQFEYLADRFWPHYAYGKNAVYDSGHHGNAILSKYPLVFWENVNISTNKYEKRGLLHAILEIPNTAVKLHAICLHLDLFEAGRVEQVQKLVERIHQIVPHDAPLIIAGDFNDWRERASGFLERELGIQEVFEEIDGRHAKTFPSWLPLLRLDRIYFRGLRVRRARCLRGKPWNQLSDHVALFSDLVIKI